MATGTASGEFATVYRRMLPLGTKTAGPSSLYLIFFFAVGFVCLNSVRGTDNINATTNLPGSWPTVTTTNGTANFASDGGTSTTMTTDMIGPVIGPNAESFRRDGDFVLGGLFDLHLSKNGACGDFNPRGLQWMHAMVYAIEQMNARKDILPNVTLGFDIYDTCADPNIAVRNSVHFIAKQDSSSCSGVTSEQGIQAVVGPGTSSEAVSVASLFNLFTLPQVSYAATSDILSESRYSYFTRTVPTDTFQARAMAHLASHFGFQTVAVLANDDGAYGVSGIYVFENEAAQRNICVAYKNIFGMDDEESEFEKIARDLGQIPQVKVIIAFANEAPMVRLLTYFAERNITGYMWIGSDGWGASNVVEDPILSRVANGMLGMFPHAEVIPDFDEYLFGLTPESLNYEDPFLNEFWQNYFQCQLPGVVAGRDAPVYKEECTGLESINASYAFTNTSLVSSVLDSVEVVARALHQCLGCIDEKCDHTATIVTGDALITCMKNVDFMGHSGFRLRPDQQGNLAEVAWYDIYNLQPSEPCSKRFKLRKVGEWRDNIGEIVFPKVEELYWPNYNVCGWSNTPPSSVCGHTCPLGSRRITADYSSCCWDCVACSENQFSNTSGALICTPCGEEQVSTEDRTGCLDLPYRYSSINSVIGIAALTVAILGWLVCAIIIVIFLLKENTVIVFHAFARSWKLILVGIMTMFASATLSAVPASNLTCLVIAGTQLLPLSVTEGTLIGVAYTSYHRRHVHLNNWALSMVAVLFFHGVCILIWIATSRPVVTKTVDRDEKLIYVDCVSSGKFDGVIIVIAYGLTLEIVGICVSFGIRNRDKNFQEGKFVFFSFIIQIMILVTITTIYLVLPVGRHYKTFVLSFGLVISSIANIGCLFVPKLYVLRFKPDINPPIKSRYRNKLWQWKFKRRHDNEEVLSPGDRFGASVRNHTARNAILENYRKALAAIQDETAQALRMHAICRNRIEDTQLSQRKKADEVAIATTSLKSSRVQMVLSSPTIEITYC